MLSARARSIAAVAVIVATFGCQQEKQAPPSPPPAQTIMSLYDRLGGATAIEAVVKDFAGRVLADERINRKFGKSDPDRLVTMLIEQVCAATGGPCTYTGRSMKVTHSGMGVTEGEFDALVEDLVTSLDHFKVPATEKNELLTALGMMKGDIVEVSGSTTGTALPGDFAPWKRP